MEILLDVMEGRNNPTTLRIKGSVHDHGLIAFVDRGSTHNFIQPRLANFLGLTVEPTHFLTVIVGNDQRISCESLCHQVPLIMAQKEFRVKLYLVLFHGSDIVLGV